MKRNLLVLPIAALLAAPMMAKADTANVTVYGTLNMDLDMAEAQNSPTGEYVGRLRVLSNSSNFGIKGWEDMGADWKFVWQAESALNLNAYNTSVLDGRNTFIGVSGNIGTFQLGFFDTPFKVVGQGLEPFWGTTVGYIQGFMSSPGMNVLSVSATSGGTTNSTAFNAQLSFDRRQGTAFQYTSPTFMGLTVKAFASTPVDKSATAANPSMWSASLGYENGPLVAGYGIERHDDFKGNILTAAGGSAPSTTTTADWGHKVAAKYNLSEETAIGAEYTLLSYASTNVAAVETDMSRSAVAVTVLQKFGDWTLRLAAAKAFNNSSGVSGSTASVDGSGAYLFDVGGSYSMSKRSDIYLVASRVQNDYQGTYNFTINPVGNGGIVSAGTYPTSIGVGLRHVF